MISIVVAASINGCIGKDGKIPWDCPEDRKFFKELTTSHSVIMGRKTWDSLPEQYKPLPNRENFVVSHLGACWGGAEGNCGSNPIWCGSLETAIELAQDLYKDKEIFIIGGAQIYKEALDKDLADRIYVTTVIEVVDGDTYFPLFDPKNWEQTHFECHGGIITVLDRKR